MKLLLRELGKEEVATLIGDVVDVGIAFVPKEDLETKKTATPVEFDAACAFILSEAYCFDAFIDKEIEIWFEDNNNVLWYSVGKIVEVTEWNKEVVIKNIGPYVNKKREQLKC